MNSHAIGRPVRWDENKFSKDENKFPWEKKKFYSQIKNFIS